MCCAFSLSPTGSRPARPPRPMRRAAGKVHGLSAGRWTGAAWKLRMSSRSGTRSMAASNSISVISQSRTVDGDQVPDPRHDRLLGAARAWSFQASRLTRIGAGRTFVTFIGRRYRLPDRERGRAFRWPLLWEVGRREHALVAYGNGSRRYPHTPIRPSRPVGPRNATTVVMAVTACLEWVFGGRHWTRTSDLLHVKHSRLSAVLRAQRVEHKCISYAVTVSASPAARLAVTRDASLASVLAPHSHSVGIT